MIDKIKAFIRKTTTFLSVGIWRVDTNGIGFLRRWIYNIIKSFMLAYRDLDIAKVNTHASALTYNTLLAIVPLLAVLFAIARGFGLENIMESELINYFSGQKDVLLKAIIFINKSLEYAQSGVFIGIGVVMLLYTVINLISSIEDRFNAIWRVKKGRSYYRQFTDYFALILITPVFVICNAGFSIVLNASAENYFLIGLVVTPFMQVISYIVTIMLFTFIYLYIPNTKIKFSSALFAAVVAGIAFQLFQEVYISGQIWISKYNAIYGSFAALPLLLLWMQLSWFITLIGVELAFAYQNVRKFSFEKEINNISRRYKDFALLVIISLIIKRFEKGEKPYTADELSENYKIPTRLISNSLYLLQEVGLITETASDEILVPAYVPAIDINKITISYFFDRIDLYGSEDFNIDIKQQFDNEWKAIINIRKDISEHEQNILIKDL